MRIDLSGKITLVTGGARGIGRACSRVLSRAGARVIVHYNRSSEQAKELQREIREEGFESAAHQADLSKAEQVARLFEAIRTQHGKLDVLVNNAGITKDKLLLNTELRDWDEVHNVNLRGAFLCTKHAVELMLANHSGKIVNIASVAALRADRGHSGYSSSKGGLVSFTRACAVELAGKNIQVNAVLPGFVPTDMTRRIIEKAGDRVLSRIPARRFGDPFDVACLVLFLASDLSGYITGQAICVDGGLSIS